MASIHQHKVELLAFGYCHENYSDMHIFPDALSKIVELFYNECNYWKIQGEVMDKFLNAKVGEAIYPPTTLTIKDIEFGCRLYPDGWKADTKNFACFYIVVKKIPSNIEYFRVSAEASCETSMMTKRFMRRWWKTGYGWGFSIFKRSDLYHPFCIVTDIDIMYKIELLAVKYKQSDEKSNDETQDFVLPIKLKKCSEYQWIIAGKAALQRMRSMHPGMSICCDNFGVDNNWTVQLFPYGFRTDAKHAGKVAIQILCLRLMYGITKMKIRYDIVLSCASEVLRELTNEQMVVFDYFDEKDILLNNRMCMECANIYIDDLVDEEWIQVSGTIVITEIYDMNGMLETDVWKKYGIIE